MLRTPLAVADAGSVRAEELIATDQVFPDRVGEVYRLAHGPDQRWYWAPRMQRDEALLIKGWDSLDDGRARFTPHGAFRLEGQGQDPNAPPRESIEVRTYLMFEGRARRPEASARELRHHTPPYSMSLRPPCRLRPGKCAGPGLPAAHRSPGHGAGGA